MRPSSFLPHCSCLDQKLHGTCFSREVGLDNLQRFLPTPAVLWYCEKHFLAPYNTLLPLLHKQWNLALHVWNTGSFPLGLLNPSVYFSHFFYSSVGLFISEDKNKTVESLQGSDKSWKPPFCVLCSRDHTFINQLCESYIIEFQINMVYGMFLNSRRNLFFLFSFFA